MQSSLRRATKYINIYNVQILISFKCFIIALTHSSVPRSASPYTFLRTTNDIRWADVYFYLQLQLVYRYSTVCGLFVARYLNSAFVWLGCLWMKTVLHNTIMRHEISGKLIITADRKLYSSTLKTCVYKLLFMARFANSSVYIIMNVIWFLLTPASSLWSHLRHALIKLRGWLFVIRTKVKFHDVSPSPSPISLDPRRLLHAQSLVRRLTRYPGAACTMNGWGCCCCCRCLLTILRPIKAKLNYL